MASGTTSPVGGALIAGVAPVTFTSAAPAVQVDADVLIEWDFDNDGDFSESVENITSYVMDASTGTGRDFPSTLTGQATAGQLRLTLRNDDDRFNFFNAASPLNAAPFSLRTGRKIRIRDSSTFVADGVLKARDRFKRTDSATLGVTETGQTWTPRASSYHIRGEVAAAAATHSSRILQTVDVGVSNHYAQATLRQVKPDTGRFVGLVVRWSDASNYTLVFYNTDATAPAVVILDRDAGVDSTLATYPVRGWEGMTIGAEVSGNTCTAYLAGVAVASATLPGVAVGVHCGLFCQYNQYTGRSPEMGDFYVWDEVPSAVNGCLWTGDLVKIETGSVAGGQKVATLTAEGVLARAARQKVASPRLPYAGAPTGAVIGDILSRAGLLHPPSNDLDEGTVITGPVGIADGDALDLARKFEETERGFLHETNEGRIGFADRAARLTASSTAWFTDTPGDGQYPYSKVIPLDHHSLIINKVDAGVAADAPSGISVTDHTGNSHVDITLPTVARDDLLVIFIANSMDGAHEWLTPIWWANHRDLQAAKGMRVYSHFCGGDESGTTVRFYTHNGSEAGFWGAQVIRIRSWYLSYNRGVTMTEPAPGPRPNPMDHGWGRFPTLFIACRIGISSPTDILWSTSNDPPDGYGNMHGFIFGNPTPAFDVGVHTAYKVDCVDSEHPSDFLGLTGATIDESVLFAVRGYNGPHTKATLENPNTTGGDGRFVTIEDRDSQEAHNATVTHKAASNLFASQAAAEAYGQAVVDEFGDDRPIFRLSFYATSSDALRDQAIARRVGHKITLTATGDTGLGVEGDFFIESVGHRWTKAAKVWETTWELSPA